MLKSNGFEDYAMNELKVEKNKGFSLVELIVVIVILTILVGVTLGGVSSYVKKGEIKYRYS